jgi:hypothetical protein
MNTKPTTGGRDDKKNDIWVLQSSTAGYRL